MNSLKEDMEETLEPPILRSEVEWALTKIKCGKAPGIDDIPIEI